MTVLQGIVIVIFFLSTLLTTFILNKLVYTSLTLAIGFGVRKTICIFDNVFQHFASYLFIYIQNSYNYYDDQYSNTVI